VVAEIQIDILYGLLGWASWGLGEDTSK